MDITRYVSKEKSDNPFVVCDNFIHRAESVYLLGNGWKEKINETLKSMFDCVKALEKDEQPECFSFTPVEEVINFLTHLVVEQKRNEDMIDFMEAFIFIAFNINENMNRYEPVNRKIAYLQRYCNNALTFSETLTVANRVVDRISTWRRWLPPSFRLSGHYYKLIKGE